MVSPLAVVRDALKRAPSLAPEDAVAKVSTLSAGLGRIGVRAGGSRALVLLQHSAPSWQQILNRCCYGSRREGTQQIGPAREISSAACAIILCFG